MKSIATAKTKEMSSHKEMMEHVTFNEVLNQDLGMTVEATYRTMTIIPRIDITNNKLPSSIKS